MSRRQTKRELARAALEIEAAEIIEGRITDGRPPPEVWRAAAKRQEAKGLPADAWYRSADDPGPPPSRPATPEPVSAPVSGDDLVLRVVRLPGLSSTPAPTTPPGRKAPTAPLVAKAPN